MDIQRRFFVIVFAIRGKIFEDYGWALSDAQFLHDIHHRIAHPEQYKKYAGLPTMSFVNYEICDVTEFYDPSRKDEIKKAAVKRIVEGMKKEVGKAPVR